MTKEEAVASIKTLCNTCELFPKCVNEKPECFKAIELAISALQAQDTETRKICNTCKYNPPSKKWPCVDCDMRADRWEPKDVPDTNVGDMISRQAAIDALERDIKFVEEEREKAITRPEKYHDRFVEASTQQIMGIAHALQAIEELPSAQPERLTDYSFEESCTECPAYDTENHRCPRFNQVIRRALKDANLEACEDCISRQAAIDTLDAGTEILRRVLDNADVVGVEREKFEWGLGLIESYISDMKELPSAQPEIIRCEGCMHNGSFDTDCPISWNGKEYCNFAERSTDE